MRVALIGGTRFIGHAAATALVERGHDVTSIHRGKHASELPGAREILADRADPHALIAALERARPEVVIETRALTKPDAEVSALATKILKLSVVVLSSHDVYAQFGRLLGHPAPEPVARVGEDAPLTVPFPYRALGEHEGGEDYDKKEVERVYQAALDDGLPGVIVLRLPATYGPRDPKRRFGTIVDALDRGERRLPRRAGGRFRWTHADVRDVGHAIALAAEQRPQGFAVYNAGEPEPPTMSERAEAIARALGVEIEWFEPEALPDAFSELGELPNDFVADTQKIRRELGFSEVVSSEQSLADLIAWLRESRSSLC